MICVCYPPKVIIKWAIKTNLLQALRGQHMYFPFEREKQTFVTKKQTFVKEIDREQWDKFTSRNGGTKVQIFISHTC